MYEKEKINLDENKNYRNVKMKEKVYYKHKFEHKMNFKYDNFSTYSELSYG